MKITKSQLKQIIKEEIEAALEEGPIGMRPVGSIEGPRGKDPRKDFTRFKTDKFAPGLAAKRECATLLSREKAMEDTMRDARSAAYGYIDQEIIDGSLRRKCEKYGYAKPKPVPPSEEELRKAKAAAIKANPAGRTTAVKGGTTLEEDLY